MIDIIVFVFGSALVLIGLLEVAKTLKAINSTLCELSQRDAAK